MANNALPSMTALLGLLAIAGYQNRDKIADMIGGLGSKVQPPSVPNGNERLNDVLGHLPKTQPTTTAGDLLSNGLRELVDRFRQHGHGEVADSWVNRGPNREVTSDQLKTAIGEDALAELSQRTGLSQPELLDRLSKQLPSAVDRY